MRNDDEDYHLQTSHIILNIGLQVCYASFTQFKFG